LLLSRARHQESGFGCVRQLLSASVCDVSLSFLTVVSAGAATRTVCASGCADTDLQAAIDAAVFGDTILLPAGQTFVTSGSMDCTSTVTPTNGRSAASRRTASASAF
jgi:hypothetical protein